MKLDITRLNGKLKQKGIWNNVKQLEKSVVLTGERIPEIRIKAKKWILMKVLNLITWVENCFMLICVWKSQLNPQATIYRSPSVFMVISSNGTVLIVKAYKVRFTQARCTAISFPAQVPQHTLSKLKNLHQRKMIQLNTAVNSRRKWHGKAQFTYQSKTGDSICAVRNKSRNWLCSIFSTSKCHHITSKRILDNNIYCRRWKICITWTFVQMKYILQN